MGEAKLRKAREAAAPPKSRERVIVASAARHLLKHFLVPWQMRGACYYSSLALRHYLAASHDIQVTAVTGFVRRPDIAWASHVWIEFEERLTDLALHYPNPPLPAGPVTIDGEVVAPGAPFMRSAGHPTDDAPVALDTPGPEMERRRNEHALFLRLATAELGEVEKYLAGAPNGWHGALQKVWVKFRAPVG